jgi:hypothetical protein
MSDLGQHYQIISGGGSYTLQPGRSRMVTVRFSPSSSGTKTCTIQTGGACSNVSCSGAGDASSAYIDITPLSSNYAQVKSNYWILSSINLVYHGISYEDPTWNNCPIGWRVNGDYFFERGIEIQNLYVPSGCTRLRVTHRADAEDPCVWLLLQIDGNEYTKSTSTTCQSYYWSVSWPFPNSSGNRDILLGTDNYHCYKDIVITCYSSAECIHYEFEGLCPSGQIYEGLVPLKRLDHEFEDISPKEE